MKQYITKKQWDEISDKQKIDFLHSHIKKRNKTMDNLALSISNELFPGIGQMIEFLGDQYIWSVMDPDKMGPTLPDDLCDELWEDVKNKLKKMKKKS